MVPFRNTDYSETFNISSKKVQIFQLCLRALFATFHSLFKAHGHIICETIGVVFWLVNNAFHISKSTLDCKHYELVRLESRKALKIFIFISVKQNISIAIESAFILQLISIF